MMTVVIISRLREETWCNGVIPVSERDSSLSERNEGLKQSGVDGIDQGPRGARVTRISRPWPQRFSAQRDPGPGGRGSS